MEKKIICIELEFLLRKAFQESALNGNNGYFGRNSIINPPQTHAKIENSLINCFLLMGYYRLNPHNLREGPVRNIPRATPGHAKHE